MNVLFIGNSYSYCNGLPALLGDLAKARGRTIATRKVTKGGVTLQWHSRNPETLEAIGEGGWDFVVLQDQSLAPIERPDILREASIDLAAKIREAGGEPVLYMTWARQHAPETQDAITETYNRVGAEIDAGVAPVGVAWGRSLAAHPEITLHTADRSHPTLEGSYLAACVFHATLLGETPVGLPNEFRTADDVAGAVGAEEAVLLQKIAWASVAASGDA